MRNDRLKIAFLEQGYELSYLTTEQGRGWHIRIWNRNDYIYLGCRRVAENYLRNKDKITN